CGAASDAPDVHSEVRDSAGVAIVENSGTGWLPHQAWRVAAEPEVDIGVLEGAPEYQLFRVRASARLSDGRIVVANGGTRELRFYSPQGEHLRTAGRQGSGPGEFEELGALWRVEGDTILVYDWRGSRLSAFGPEGDFVRSTRLQTGEGVTFPMPLGATADRKLLATTGGVFFAGDEKTGVSRDSSAIVVYDLEGTPEDTLGIFPGNEAYVKSDGRSISVRSLAFGRSLRSGVHGERLYAGATDRYQVGVWRTDGTLERLIRRAHVPMEVTPADIQTYKDEQLAAMDGQSQRFLESTRQVLEEMPYPQTFPAFRALQVDEDGHLWVAEERRPGDERSLWTVFDGEGRMLGQVELPEGLSVHAIGRDWVLGLWSDELDVEHVRLHRLEKAPEGVAGG
ncbi:MAG TPA: hypothetical protein VMK65_08090, partial [Longimicrobiales bacterium]|nr:hypothetical protein [Longimicrobiales bacterium]